jgi:hypothetical protein
MDEYTRRVGPNGRVSWVYRGKVIAASRVPDDVKGGLEARKSSVERRSPSRKSPGARGRQSAGRRSPKRSPPDVTPKDDYKAKYDLLVERYAYVDQLLDRYVREASALNGWKAGKDQKSVALRETAVNDLVRRLAETRMT